MHLNLMALYAGPDQVMTVTSAFASIVGVVLIFWHKVVALFTKSVSFFRRSSKSTSGASPQNTPKTPA
jgi:undecaprenyl pyrophosphate phosphatase UppP